jgi:hypothetical protein
MAEASISGLARILSSEPLPQMPMFRTDDPQRIAAEMEQYARNVHNYLIRLFGNFTATNIIQTIINENGGAYARIITKYLHVKTTSPDLIVLDDQYDWRGTFVGVSYLMHTTNGTLLVTEPEEVFAEFLSYNVSTVPGSEYPFTLKTISPNFGGDIQIEEDGRLVLNINGTGESFIGISIIAFARIAQPNVYVQVGNNH